MEKNHHQNSNPQITIEDCWERQRCVLLDVRSPKEFIEGAIPGAINLPLLEESERETVGILYKQYGQQAAINQGYKILEPKLDHLKRQFRQFSQEDEIVVYCARGGMRSQVITSLMRSFAFRVLQLTGGYKAFRNWNLAQLAQVQLKHLFVLHGQTGVGKTLVLNRLDNAIDLEGLAHHRGSMFGGIGKQAITQKTFESSLLVAINGLDQSKPIFVEGESKKIGKLTIPHNIFNQMKLASNILLSAPMPIRVERTIDEYITRQPKEKPEIRKVIGYLVKSLGKAIVAKLEGLFDAGNYQDCFQQILELHYDKKYAHALNQLSYLKTVEVEHVETAVAEIKHCAVLTKS